MSIKISITGDLASGKSTLSASLSEKLGLEPISVGALVRDLAKTQNINILEANSNIAKSAWMDRQVDDAVEMKIKEVETNNRPYIIDARVGFYYAPNSLKIKLITNPMISAERAFSAARQSEEYKTLEEAYSALQDRRNLERSRFIERYGVDVDDLKNFDLVIDTSLIKKEHTSDIVEMVLTAKAQGKPFPQFWCHPGQVIPGGQSHRDFKIETAKNLIADMVDNKFDHLKCMTELSALTVDRTRQGYLLLHDGHHRMVAANVASLPYIGFNLNTQEAEFSSRTLSSMYDNYDAMDYLSKDFVKGHPSHIPFWGNYNNGLDYEALNAMKFNFVNDFVTWRDSPTSPARSNTP